MEEIFPTFKDVSLTCLRWGFGLFAGSLLGVAAALLEVMAEKVIRRISLLPQGSFAASLDFLRSLPIIALVPIVQMPGVEEVWKIGIIAWAVMFPVWLSVRSARTKQMIDSELLMLARGISAADYLRSYHFPKALGGFLRGVEISIGVAWLSVVAAEWVGTFTVGFWAGGLGYKIIKAHDANSWAGMLLCLAAFGCLGLSSAWLLRMILLKSRNWVIGFDPLYDYSNEQSKR